MSAYVRYGSYRDVMRRIRALKAPIYKNVSGKWFRR